MTGVRGAVPRAAVLALAMVVAGCAGRPTVPMRAPELTRIADGVWVHTSWYAYPGGATFPSNGLVVRDGDGVTLVDTAWGETATVALLDIIRRQIRLPVRTAVITHAHGDRILGVDVLEAGGTRVLALPMTNRRAVAVGLPVPDDTLAGLRDPGDRVRVGRIEVMFPGAGHAPDNLVVGVPNTGVLFGGCAIRAASSGSPGNLGDADLRAWLRALDRIEARYGRARVVVPGHGEVGGAGLIEHTRRLVRGAAG